MLHNIYYTVYLGYKDIYLIYISLYYTSLILVRLPILAGESLNARNKP